MSRWAFSLGVCALWVATGCVADAPEVDEEADVQPPPSDTAPPGPIPDGGPDSGDSDMGGPECPLRIA